jgi:hypothetical protein
MIKRPLTYIFAASLRIFLFVLCIGFLQACGVDNSKETSEISSAIGGRPTDFLAPKAVIFGADTICAIKSVDQRKVNHAASCHSAMVR